MLGMDECNAAVAYNDIARRLFGTDAFLTQSIVKRDVTRWIANVVALAWHRWRGLLKNRVKTLNSLREKVDEAYKGTCLLSVPRAVLTNSSV